MLTLILVLRGDGKCPSFVGIVKCSAVDWAMLAILLLAVVGFTLIAIFCVLKPSYKAKKEAGFSFVKGDTEMTNKSYITLLLIAFFGAFAGAFTGLGVGSIFNPTLISLDMHPASGGATGMYLTFWVVGCGTIVMGIIGMIPWDYFGVLNALVILGTFPGLWL